MNQKNEKEPNLANKLNTMYDKNYTATKSLQVMKRYQSQDTLNQQSSSSKMKLQINK